MYFNAKMILSAITILLCGIYADGEAKSKRRKEITSRESQSKVRTSTHSGARSGASKTKSEPINVKIKTIEKPAPAEVKEVKNVPPPAEVKEVKILPAPAEVKTAPAPVKEPAVQPAVLKEPPAVKVSEPAPKNPLLAHLK